MKILTYPYLRAMKYPIILFDADDTLFDFKKASLHAFARTIEHFKIPKTDGLYSLYKAINKEVWESFERKEINAEELRPLRFERFLHDIHEERDPVEMSQFYLEKLSQSDQLLDEARPLVEGLLSDGHRLALITNGLKEVQRPRIAKAKMGGYFEAIIVSDEIGVAKPDARFFEHAFGKIGRPEKGQVVVVGDSLSSDIQGGNNFGVSTCWFNPAQNANRSPHLPTYEIGKLSALHKIVR